MRYIPARNHRQLQSYQAGFTFGKLYATKIETMTTNRLALIVQSLRPRSTFDASFYRQGFELGFLAQIARTGNLVTSDPQSQEKENLIMGKLQQAVDNNSSFPEFMKPATLAERGAHLCITEISERPATDRFDAQWMLRVKMSLEVAGELGDNESIDPEGNVTRTITFGKGAKGPNSRDRILSQLINDVPVHNVICVAIASTIRGRSPYIDLQEHNGLCVCGHSDDDDGSLDMEEHPF